MQILQAGVSIIMTEQNVRRALQVADRIGVLASGSMVCEGPPKALTGNKELATQDLKTVNKT